MPVPVPVHGGAPREVHRGKVACARGIVWTGLPARSLEKSPGHSGRHGSVRAAYCLDSRVHLVRESAIARGTSRAAREWVGPRVARRSRQHNHKDQGVVGVRVEILSSTQKSQTAV